MESKKVKKCWICGSGISPSWAYYTIDLTTSPVYSHIGCQIKLDAEKNHWDILEDATEPHVEIAPIVWLYSEVVSGRSVEATIRQYESNFFCWVTIGDDGYINTVGNSGTTETIEEAKQAVEDNIIYYLMYC